MTRDSLKHCAAVTLCAVLGCQGEERDFRYGPVPDGPAGTEQGSVGSRTPSGDDAPRASVGSRCNDLDVELLRPFTTTPPARVSSFMRVLACDGEPIGRLTEEAFLLKENATTISALEASPRIVPNRKDFRVHTLVLVDLSGSITRDEGGVKAVREAVGEFLGTISTSTSELDHRVSIQAFDGRAGTQEVSAFTPDLAAVAADAAAIECNDTFCVDTSTNLNGAVVTALDALDAQVGDAEAAGVDFNEAFLVVFTDGTDQAGRVSYDAMVDAVEATDHRLLTIGLGGEIDAESLRQVGRDGFELAKDQAQLAESFATTAARIGALAGSFYQVDYCSPKRAGDHTLSIQVSYDGITGSVEGRFSAEGFTFGCDANAPAP